MTTIVRNMDGCDIAHEALMLEEYGEEVMCAAGDLQLMQVGERPIAQIDRQENDRGRTTFSTVALPSAPEEVIESFGLLRSTAFPQCP
jgi:hypothetical protein